jgi:hypothetical protein
MCWSIAEAFSPSPTTTTNKKLFDLLAINYSIKKKVLVENKSIQGQVNTMAEWVGDTERSLCKVLVTSGCCI